MRKNTNEEKNLLICSMREMLAILLMAIGVPLITTVKDEVAPLKQQFSTSVATGVFKTCSLTF